MLLFDNCSLSEHVKNVKESFDKSSGRQFEPYSKQWAPVSYPYKRTAGYWTELRFLLISQVHDHKYVLYRDSSDSSVVELTFYKSQTGKRQGKREAGK